MGNVTDQRKSGSRMKHVGTSTLSSSSASNEQSRPSDEDKIQIHNNSDKEVNNIGVNNGDNKKLHASPLRRRLQATFARHLATGKTVSAGPATETTTKNDRPAQDEFRKPLTRKERDVDVISAANKANSDKMKSPGRLKRLSPFRMATQSMAVNRPSQTLNDECILTAKARSQGTCSAANDLTNPVQYACQSESSSPSSGQCKKYGTKMIMGQMLITTTTTSPSRSPLSSSSSGIKSQPCSASSCSIRNSAPCTSIGAHGSCNQGMAKNSSPSAGLMNRRNSILTVGGNQNQHHSRQPAAGENNLELSSSGNSRNSCNCDDHLEDMIIPYEHPTRISHGFWLQRYSNLHKLQSDHGNNNNSNSNSDHSQHQIHHNHNHAIVHHHQNTPVQSHPSPTINHNLRTGAAGDHNNNNNNNNGSNATSSNSNNVATAIQSASYLPDMTIMATSSAPTMETLSSHHASSLDSRPVSASDARMPIDGHQNGAAAANRHQQNQQQGASAGGDDKATSLESATGAHQSLASVTTSQSMASNQHQQQSTKTRQANSKTSLSHSLAGLSGNYNNWSRGKTRTASPKLERLANEPPVDNLTASNEQGNEPELEERPSSWGNCNQSNSKHQSRRFFARCRNLVARRLRSASSGNGSADRQHQDQYDKSNSSRPNAGIRPDATVNINQDKKTHFVSHHDDTTDADIDEKNYSAREKLAHSDNNNQHLPACRWLVKRLTPSPLRNCNFLKQTQITNKDQKKQQIQEADHVETSRNQELLHSDVCYIANDAHDIYLDADPDRDVVGDNDYNNTVNSKRIRDNVVDLDGCQESSQSGDLENKSSKTVARSAFVNGKGSSEQKYNTDRHRNQSFVADQFGSGVKQPLGSTGSVGLSASAGCFSSSNQNQMTIMLAQGGNESNGMSSRPLTLTSLDKSRNVGQNRQKQEANLMVETSEENNKELVEADAGVDVDVGDDKGVFPIAKNSKQTHNQLTIFGSPIFRRITKRVLMSGAKYNNRRRGQTSQAMEGRESEGQIRVKQKSGYSYDGTQFESNDIKGRDDSKLRAMIDKGSQSATGKNLIGRKWRKGCLDTEQAADETQRSSSCAPVNTNFNMKQNANLPQQSGKQRIKKHLKWDENQYHQHENKAVDLHAICDIVDSQRAAGDEDWPHEQQQQQEHINSSGRGSANRNGMAKPGQAVMQGAGARPSVAPPPVPAAPKRKNYSSRVHLEGERESSVDIMQCENVTNYKLKQIDDTAPANNKITAASDNLDPEQEKTTTQPSVTTTSDGCDVNISTNRSRNYNDYANYHEESGQQSGSQNTSEMLSTKPVARHPSTNSSCMQNKDDPILHFGRPNFLPFCEIIGSSSIQTLTDKIRFSLEELQRQQQQNQRHYERPLGVESILSTETGTGRTADDAREQCVQSDELHLQDNYATKKFSESNDDLERDQKYISLIRPVPSSSPSISSIRERSSVDQLPSSMLSQQEEQRAKKQNRTESRVAFEDDVDDDDCDSGNGFVSQTRLRPAEVVSKANAPCNGKQTSLSSSQDHHQVEDERNRDLQPHPSRSEPQVPPPAPNFKSPTGNSSLQTSSGVGSQIATNIKRLIKRQQSVDSYRMARELKNKMRRQQEANTVMAKKTGNQQRAGTSHQGSSKPTSAAAAADSSKSAYATSGNTTPNKQSASFQKCVASQESGTKIGVGPRSDESFLAATKRKASVCAGTLARARGTLNFVRPNWAESLVVTESSGEKSNLYGQVDPIVSVKINTDDAHNDDNNEQNDGNNSSNDRKPKPPNTLNLSVVPNCLSSSSGRDNHASTFVVGSFSGSITPTYPTHHLPSSHYVAKKYSNASTISSSIGGNETSSIAANSSLYLGLDLSFQVDGGSSPISQYNCTVSDTDTSMAISPQPITIPIQMAIGLENVIASTIPTLTDASGTNNINNNQQPLTAGTTSFINGKPADGLISEGQTGLGTTPLVPIMTEDEATLIAKRANLAEGIYENKVGLGEDMKFLASLPELCDITFLVGESREPVCAVKSVLAARSRVFHKILFGSRFHSASERYQMQTFGHNGLPMNQQQYSKSSVETSMDDSLIDGRNNQSEQHNKLFGVNRKSPNSRSTSPNNINKQQHDSVDSHQAGYWSVTLNMSGYNNNIGTPTDGVVETNPSSNAKQNQGRSSVVSGRDSSHSSHQGGQEPVLTFGSGPVKGSGRSSKSSFKNRTTNWITNRDHSWGDNSGGGGRRFSRIFMKRISDSSIKHHNKQGAAAAAAAAAAATAAGSHNYQSLNQYQILNHHLINRKDSSNNHHQRRHLLHHNNSLGSMMLGSSGSSDKYHHDHHHNKNDLDKMSKSQTSTTMIIEEFEPDVFRQLIEYIHTGCVLLQARTLLGLLNAADYYGLEQLRKACLRFVSCCINVDTVCSLLATAERYIQYKCTKSIVQKVLEFVDNHADEIFKLNAFGLLPEHVVRLILARDGLQADELVKYNGVYTWCEHYCRSYEITNIADVMRNFLDMIQFHKIPTQALLAEIYPTHIVPDNIFLSALAYQAEPSKFEHTNQTLRARRMTLPNPVISKRSSFCSEADDERDESGESKKKQAEKGGADADSDSSQANTNEAPRSDTRGASFGRKQSDKDKKTHRKSSRPSAGTSLMLSLFQMSGNMSESVQKYDRSHSSSGSTIHHDNSISSARNNHQELSAKSASPVLPTTGHGDSRTGQRKSYQHIEMSVQAKTPVSSASTKRKGSIAQAGISGMMKISHRLSIKRRQSTASPNNNASANLSSASKSKIGLLHRKAPAIYKSEVEPIDPNDPLALGQQILNAYLLEKGRREMEEAERRAEEETRRRLEVSKQSSIGNPTVNIASVSTTTTTSAPTTSSTSASSSAQATKTSIHRTGFDDFSQSTSCTENPTNAAHVGSTSLATKSQSNLTRRSSNRKSFKDFKHISRRIFSRHQSNKHLQSETSHDSASQDTKLAGCGSFAGSATATTVRSSPPASKEGKKRSVFRIKRSETVFEATSCP